jgi:hypothetical protein
MTRGCALQTGPLTRISSSGASFIGQFFLKEQVMVFESWGNMVPSGHHDCLQDGWHQVTENRSPSETCAFVPAS